jgi:hypothetical protein
MADVTVRNVDAMMLKKLKMKAVEEGATLGQELNKAIYEFVNKPRQKKSSAFLAIKPRDLGDPLLREKIDELAFSD